MEKSERFGLVLEPDEKRVLKELAHSEGGLSSAAMVRRLIREAAKARGLWHVNNREIASIGGQHDH